MNAAKALKIIVLIFGCTVNQMPDFLYVMKYSLRLFKKTYTPNL